ncbi:MAG: ABC transporter ATP-binding protein [Proteobacteria bacterium]|nr:ABC transporter ATP-binding protein [Pseudomonadota bacterium]
MALINVKNISFSYGARIIFSQISFCVEPGQVYCLLGPNGCGKTTLLDCVLGFLTPDEGQILIRGKDSALCRSGWLSKSMSYVPQNHEGTFPYTVFDMVLMGRAAHIPFFSSPSPDDKDISWEAIEQVGLTEMAMRPYTLLSGGERQLVLIARALAQQAPVIIMDEPTAHLDFKHEFIVLETIMNLVRTRGLALVISTHFPNQAYYFESHQIPTTVAMLHKGRFIHSGPPDQVLTKDGIRTLYGIDSTIVSFDNNGAPLKHVIPVKTLDSEGERP